MERDTILLLVSEYLRLPADDLATSETVQDFLDETEGAAPAAVVAMLCRQFAPEAGQTAQTRARDAVLMLARAFELAEAYEAEFWRQTVDALLDGGLSEQAYDAGWQRGAERDLGTAVSQ